MAPAEVDANEVNAGFYGHLAEGRDDYWHKMAAPRHRRAVILGLVRGLRPARLVDLGCGNGQLLRAIAAARPEAQLCGIDLSEPQVEANRRSMPDVVWQVAVLDTAEGPSADSKGAFDCVVASELIEHTGRPDLLLRRALRLAVPGGHLILSTQSGPIGETERRVGHQRHFDCTEIAGLLEANGWRALRVWNTGFPFHDLSKRIANLRPEGSLRRFDGKRYGLAENTVCFVLRALFRLNSQTRGAQLFALARKPAAAPAGL